MKFEKNTLLHEPIKFTDRQRTAAKKALKKERKKSWFVQRIYVIQVNRRETSTKVKNLQ